jgi:menaquinone-dependent protoporphyrinogen IX oxidase
VLIVYHTVTKQSGRVADAIAKQLEARGCAVTKAMIEFTDERWARKLSQFPMNRPMAQIVSILPAQMRHKTGEIHTPAEAEAGDYDLVLIASPTWWFQTCMTIRSYLESPAARAILDGKPFATVSISRRYYSINLGQQRKLAEKNGGRFTDKTHFVAAGGQVKSMLSWLGIHEARRATGARHGAKDARTQSEARFRGTGKSLCRRPPGPSSAATRRGYRRVKDPLRGFPIRDERGWVDVAIERVAVTAA